MMKKVYVFMTALACVLGWGCFSFRTDAAEAGNPLPQEEEEQTEQEETEVQDGYITISVDAEDDNGELTYAIDSDAPEAFGDSNVFIIDPTVPHTIYVKDGAGNITSQSFQPIGVEYREDSGYTGLLANDNGAGNNSGVSDPESAAAGEEYQDAAEDGAGTMYDKVTTDGTDAFSRVFYTVTTKEGEVFYLVIDQNRGQDNVYLLNMVTVDELQALAEENGYAISERESAANPVNLSDGETIEDVMGNAPAASTKKKGGGVKTNMKSTIIILVVAVIGGGAYYYLKVVKKKKDAAMDEIDNALDMEDFTTDEPDEGEEIDMPADQTVSDEEFYSMYGDDEEESAYLDMDPDEDPYNDEEGENE